MKKYSPYLLVFLGLLWPFAVLVLYYWIHKPLTPQLAVDLVLLGWRLVAALILVVLAGGLGFRLTTLPALHPLARLSLQAGLGLGLFGLGVMLIGVSAGLPRWLFWAVLPVLAFFLRRPAVGWTRQWSALGELWRESGRFSRALGILLAVGLAAALSIALAPPIKFDSLHYHLVMPEAYLRLGRVVYLPWLPMSGYPQTTEMLYTWAIALGGRQTATVLSWCIAPLAAVGLLGYLRQRFGVRPAWVGITALFSGYTLIAAPAWAYTDWLGLYMGLGCLVSLDLWRQEGKRAQLLLAGVFAGLAVSIKYSAGLLVLAGITALAWHAWKRRDRFFPAAIQFGLAATLILLPWLVKNWFTTGNPIYPSFFPAGAMDAARLAIYQGMPPVGNWLDFFFLPVRATLMGVEGGEGYSASIGPLLLGLGALAWIKAKELAGDQRAALQNAAILSVAGLIIWAVGNRFSGYLIQSRYYFLLFPAFAVLAAAGYNAIEKLSLPNLRLGRILSALILLVLGLNTLEVSLISLKSGAPQAALGLTSQDEYLTDNLGWFQPAMQAVNQLPEGSRVQLIYEPRSLYCQPVCQPDELLDRWQRDYYTLGDFAKIHERWLQEGATHILVYRSGVEFLLENDDPHHPHAVLLALNDYLQELPVVQDFGGVYELYSLSVRR